MSIPAELNGSTRAERNKDGFPADAPAMLPPQFKTERPVEGPQSDTRKAELLKKTQRVPLDLVCPVGVVYEAQAMREGFIKYGYASFLNDSVPMSARACLAAAKRHIERLLAGEDRAPEPMATHHAGHARAMLGIYLECMEAGKLIDDRHPRHLKDPYVGRLLDRLAKENAEQK